MRFKVSLCLAALLAGCGSPETFQEQAPEIETAEPAGKNFNIVARQELLSESLAMQQLSMLIEQIAQGVQSGLPGPNEQTEFVQLQLGYASLDRLGNEGTLDFGTIRLPLEDLRQAKIDNLVGTQFLELADRVSPSVGFEPAIAYCSDFDNVSLNERWCTLVAEGLILGEGSSNDDNS